MRKEILPRSLFIDWVEYVTDYNCNEGDQFGGNVKFILEYIEFKESKESKCQCPVIIMIANIYRIFMC